MKFNILIILKNYLLAQTKDLFLYGKCKLMAIVTKSVPLSGDLYDMFLKQKQKIKQKVFFNINNRLTNPFRKKKI